MEHLAKEAAELSITVPDVQPKLSLGWLKHNLENGHIPCLAIMNTLDGHYIYIMTEFGVFANVR
ncbi:MAG: serine/threonine-protein kinase HipA [Halioglobus sp.]|jgi:serine/threonine-protein kinase HipA